MRFNITNLTEAQNKLINEAVQSDFDAIQVHGSTARTARRLAELGLGTLTTDRTVDSFKRFALSSRELTASIKISSVERLPFGSFTTATLVKPTN